MWERFGESSEERWGWEIGSGWRFAVLVPPRGETRLISRVRKDLWVPFVSLARGTDGFTVRKTGLVCHQGNSKRWRRQIPEKAGQKSEAESNLGGSAACPAVPTGFGDRQVATGDRAIVTRGLWHLCCWLTRLDSSGMGSLGCEKSTW